jgi:hypothetical protein
MENEENILEFHSRISERIYATLDRISEDVDNGYISTKMAKRIISKVQVFNYHRDTIMEKHKAGEITSKGMKIMAGKAGQQCIDEINKIMAEAPLQFQERLI